MANLLIAPLDVLIDKRLSDPERRVLLALYSFRGKDTNTVWPSLNLLSERALINDKTRISKLTKSLSEKGWLTKKKRGFTGGNSYTLTTPSNLDCSTNLALKAKLEPNTNTNLDCNTKSNLDSDTKCKEEYIEQTIEQTNKNICRKPDSFKQFFKIYPENKKGGRDESAWKKAKSLKLTDNDFMLMIADLEKRKVLCPSWYSKYAIGICKYLDEHFWKTPITPEGDSNDQSGDKHGNFKQRDYQSGASDLSKLDWVNG